MICPTVGSTYYFKIGNDPKLRQCKVHRISGATYNRDADYIVLEETIGFIIPKKVLSYYKLFDVEAIIKL